MAGFGDVEILFSKFDYFLDICAQRFKSVAAEDMLNIFKCCLFIENTANALKNKECFDGFLGAFHLWAKKSNKLKTYEPKVFLLACDYCLEKIFESKMPSKNIDVAIRIYCSMHSKKRLEEFLENYMSTHKAYKALKKYALISAENSTLSYKLILDVWAEYYNLGLQDQLSKLVDYKLIDYKLEEILDVHFTILSLETVDSVELQVKDMILAKLENHMQVRNLLIENFWMTIIFQIKPEVLSKVCSLYPTFLELLFQFLYYLICMMTFKQSDRKWIPNPNTFCPRITYKNVVDFIKSIITHTSVFEFIHHKMLASLKSTGCERWVAIYDDVFLQ